MSSQYLLQRHGQSIVELFEKTGVHVECWRLIYSYARLVVVIERGEPQQEGVEVALWDCFQVLSS